MWSQRAAESRGGTRTSPVMRSHRSPAGSNNLSGSPLIHCISKKVRIFFICFLMCLDWNCFLFSCFPMCFDWNCPLFSCFPMCLNWYFPLFSAFLGHPNFVSSRCTIYVILVHKRNAHVFLSFKIRMNSTKFVFHFISLWFCSCSWTPELKFWAFLNELIVHGLGASNLSIYTTNTSNYWINRMKRLISNALWCRVPVSNYRHE